MDLSYALDYPRIPGNAPQRVHLLLRIETWPQEGGAERKPLNLSLALDRSGSMGGEKLAAVKEAAVAFAQRLTPRDWFSVVAFESRVEVVIAPTPVTDIEYIRRRIEALVTGVSTNLSGGWLKALSLVGQRRGAEFLHRVLLLTDGQANLGVADQASLVEIARQQREDLGIVTTTLGFGADFNQNDLTAIATAGGGHFHYVDSPEKASTAFLQEFGEIARVFGQNCEVGLTPAETVSSCEILGEVPRTVEGRTHTLSLGDVRDRDLKQVLAAFTLPAGLPAGPLELATLHVRYDAVRGKVGSRHHVLAVKVEVAPGETLSAAPAPEVHRALVMEDVARLKRQAMARLDRSDAGGARGDLEAALRLLSQNESLDPEAFLREAENIRALAAQSDSTASAAGLQKALAAQAHEQLAQRGAYAAAPSADSRIFAFAPSQREVLSDIADFLKATLKGFGHDAQRITHLEFAVRELVENAMEHGCKGRTDPQIEVELSLARNYAKAVVRDNGPGFDFAATLAREEQESAGPQTAKRGRGLISVRRVADTLHANAAGNEITAAIRRETLRVTDGTAQTLSEKGVGEIRILTVRGHLDSTTFEPLERRINEILEAGCYKIIADLSGCDYISSAGAGVLMCAIGTSQENEGDIILVCPSEHVKLVLNLLGANEVFRFAPTVEAAVKMLTDG